MSDHALIELRDVTRTFDPDQTTGVRGVSLTIERGEFVAIIGPSGAGKSTLLNVLGLLDRPDSGQYLINGRDVSRLPERSRNQLRSHFFGFVFQSAFVLGDETTLQNASLGLRIQSEPVYGRTDRARRALELVGIAQKASSAGRLLSGGERQRLAIARAIATNPSVVLADEPTGNLDSENGRLVLEHLRELNRLGTTIVLITHDRDIASHAARRIHVIDGHVREEPRPDRPRVGDQELAPRKVPPFAALLDDLGDALSAMSHRFVRTLLLILAFGLGVGGLVTAVGLSESASAQVSQRLTAAALDEVRVNLPDSGDLVAGDQPQLRRWINQVKKLPHVVDAGWVAQVGASSAQVRRLGPDEPAPMDSLQVLAASPSYLRLEGARSASAGAEVALASPGITDSAWLGTGAAKSLNAAPPGPGSTIWANGRLLTVVGDVRAGNRSPQIADTVIVSPDVIAGERDVAVTLLVRTETGFPATVADALPVALDPANPGRFDVETVADLRNLRVGVADDLGAFVGILSGVLLALACVSAATTMYLTVQSRAYEIALRRAIGASRAAVARLFMVEGVVVGIVGGVAGAAIGTAGALAAASWRGWAPVLPPEIAPIGVGLGMLTGILSAVVPAIAASRRDPAQAIRG